MAEVALTSVITMLADVAGNLIFEEGSHLYRLKENICWLENQLSLMQAYQAAAEAKQVNDPRVATLIKQIREMAHHVEDTLEDFLPKIESYRSRGFIMKTATLLSYGLTCSKFAEEIEKIKRQVEEIDAARIRYDIPVIDAALAERAVNFDPRIDALYVDDDVVLGLDEDIVDLMKKLLSEEEGLISVAVVGIAGVGKTTLAKKVFNIIKEQFSCSALISISQQPNVKDIIDNIAKQVGLAEQEQKENLEANLYKFLKEKKYIFLLDDIWNDHSWNSLKECFPTADCMNGSRIIITSRYTYVGRYICGGGRYLHELKVLDFPTSWNLFNKLIMPTLRGDNQGFENPFLRKIGEEIVRQCGGLPLAIVVTIGMLRAEGTTEEKWKEVLQSMRNDIDDKCSQILALSYKDLPSTLKPCFLYLGVFPEDYEVSVSELVRLWMAEKFIGDYEGREPEDVGQSYINKLVSRNLVQVVKRKHNGRVNRIRIHDLLHSLCINIAREINFLHASSDNRSHTSGSKHRRLSAHQGIDEVFYFGESISGIRTLHVFKKSEENSRTNHKKLMCNQKLQVLRIEGIPDVGMKGSCQPKYLKFSGFGSSLHFSKQNFKQLQTLDLRRFDHDALIIPNAIWQMKQLRHLLLEDQEIARVPTCCSGDISLPNLQTLGYVYFMDIDFFGADTFCNVRKLKVNINGFDLSEKFCGQVPISSKLETLELFYANPNLSMRRRLRLLALSVRRRLNPLQLEETFNLSKYNNLTKLEISYIKFRQLPGMDHFPPNLLKLLLFGNELEEDPMQVLKKFPKLKILKLSARSYFGRKLDCSGADSFPQLEVLHLSNLWNLEEVTDGGVRGMHNLRKFIVRNCPSLERYPEWLKQLRTEE